MGEQAAENLGRAPPLQAALSRILAGGRSADDVTVTYDDSHLLWGGIVISIDGSGACERRRWDRGAKTPAVTPGSVNPAQFRELLQLLSDLNVWEQQTPDRAPAPDEVRAAVTVRVGDLTGGCWEWYQELEQRGRLSVIRAKMSALVQTEFEQRGTVNREADIEMFRQALAPVFATYGVSGSPTERERVDESYVLGAATGAHVGVSTLRGNSDPYNATVAIVTLESRNFVDPQSSAPVEILVELEYLAWSASVLRYRLVGPPSDVENLRNALAPALARCDFAG